MNTPAEVNITQLAVHLIKPRVLDDQVQLRIYLKQTNHNLPIKEIPSSCSAHFHAPFQQSCATFLALSLLFPSLSFPCLLQPSSL